MAQITLNSSSEELAHPEKIDRDHVLRRLQDWRERVYALYAALQEALRDSPFTVNREVRLIPQEWMLDKFGINRAEQEIDILRIVRPEGDNAAILSPVGLWIVGANGRVDLIIMHAIGREAYMLIDESKPLSGAARWMRSPAARPLEREPFDPHWLVQKLR